MMDQCHLSYIVLLFPMKTIISVVHDHKDRHYELCDLLFVYRINKVLDFFIEIIFSLFYTFALPIEVKQDSRANAPTYISK